MTFTYVRIMKDEFYSPGTTGMAGGLEQEISLGGVNRELNALRFVHGHVKGGLLLEGIRVVSYFHGIVCLRFVEVYSGGVVFVYEHA